MTDEDMAARKAGDGRSPQVTVTLSEGCYTEFNEVCEYKKIQLGTYIRNLIEQHHESPEFASLLRRARKTGDWADMEIVELVEALSSADRKEAIAYLKQLAD